MTDEKEYAPRYVRMKSMKELIRSKKIKIEDMSDSGEFCHFKILPNGPTIGQWNQFDEVLMVVDRSTVHENLVKMAPDLYEEVP